MVREDTNHGEKIPIGTIGNSRTALPEEPMHLLSKKKATYKTPGWFVGTQTMA
jgi:hypothetical protein